MFVVSISGQGENFQEFVSCGHFVGFTLTKKIQPWTSIYKNRRETSKKNIIYLDFDRSCENCLLKIRMCKRKPFVPTNVRSSFHASERPCAPVKSKPSTVYRVLRTTLDSSQGNKHIFRKLYQSLGQWHQNRSAHSVTYTRTARVVVSCLSLRKL